MGADEDDGAATRVWLGAEEDPIRPPPNRLKWVALGLLVAMCSVIVVIAVVASRSDKRGASKVTAHAGPSAAAAEVVRTEPAAASSTWTPPKGESRTIEISAVGFPSFSESDLGTLFDAKLRRLSRSPNLFAKRIVSKLPRNEFVHSFTRVQSQLELGIVIATILGGSYRRDRFYAMYRALEVGEVLRVDDRAPMVEPPAEATFYLAEIHVGSSYDVVIEGLSRDMGAKLDRELTGGELALSIGSSASDYRVVARGLGLRPRHGEAIFAKTAEQIEAAYTTEGAAVPVRVVFRQIPGRKLASDRFKWPTPLTEQSFRLQENQSKAFEVPAGTYSIFVETRPSGVEVRWRDADCKQGTFLGLTTSCVLSAPATLTITNPSLLGMGSAEAVSLSLYKGKDQSAVESSSPGR